MVSTLLLVTLLVDGGIVENDLTFSMNASPYRKQRANRRVTPITSGANDDGGKGKRDRCYTRDQAVAACCLIVVLVTRIPYISRGFDASYPASHRNSNYYSHGVNVIEHLRYRGDVSLKVVPPHCVVYVIYPSFLIIE